MNYDTRSHHRHHVILAYKNFSNDCNVSHIGLGVTAAYTAKTLNHHGIYTQAKPVFGADDLSVFIQSQESTPRPVTHVVIMAGWVATVSLAAMVRQFPHITFALNCHSNAGFLQAEPNAVKLEREAIDLETGLPNFHACSNNKRFSEGLMKMYGRPVQFLPNLYFLHGQEPIHRPKYNGGTLRLGMFGSLRVYKNFSTAVAAGIAVAHQLKVPTEIWINRGRNDGDTNPVYQTALAWTRGLPNVQLKEYHWASWPDFKRMVSSMNLLFQPSYTETFNNVTADGVVEGVPSVVSNVIEWCPKSWMANPDDLGEVAGTAIRLLNDHDAAQDGYNHLREYVKHGLGIWKSFLGRPQPMPYFPGDPGWTFFGGQSQ
jgi:hypothetical protein